ncbi:MAG: iron ABC transporter permease [Rhodobacteraceae bacterium]|nr:iron ABC transporter permease [Paracoccaceae bacterium]
MLTRVIPSGHGRSLRSRAPHYASRLILLVIVGAAFAPVIRVMYEPLADFGGQLQKAAAIPAIGQTLLNTLMLAAGSVILAMTIGTFFGWAAAQLSPRMAKMASILTTSSLFVPPIAGVIGWIFLFTPRIGYLNVLLRSTPFFGGNSGPVDIRTLTGIVLIDTIYLIPFVFLYVSTALRAVDPALEHAAMVCGSSWIGAQFRIVLRIIRPAIIYGAVIVTLLGLGQFTVPLILGSNHGLNVITTEIFNQMEVRAVPQEATAAFLSLPLVLAGFLLIYLQRRGVGDVRRYGITSKGVSGRRQARNYLLVPIVLYAFIAVVPAVVALFIVALSPFWSATIDVGQFSLRAFQQIWDNPTILRSIVNSVQISIIGVVVGLVGSFVVARYIISPARTRFGTLIDYTINMPMTIPHIVLGLGIFLVFAVGPFRLYGSSWLYVIAYVILYLPHGVRMVQSGLVQMGTTHEAAARVCGAGQFQALRTVLVPMLRRSFASSGLLMFVLMSREFSASALLRTPSNQVMSTRLFDSYNNGTFTDTAAIALVMIGVSFVGVSLITLLGGRAVNDPH